MIKKVGFAFILLTSLIAQTANSAIRHHTLIAGDGFRIELPINEEYIISNNFIFPIKASCVIEGDDKDGPYSLNINMLKNTSTINGVSYSEGTTQELFVKNGETLRIYAPFAAKVKLLNQGPKQIAATCTGSFF